MHPIILVLGRVVITTLVLSAIAAAINSILAKGTEEEINEHFRKKSTTDPDYFKKVYQAIKAGHFSKERAAFLYQKMSEFSDGGFAH